MGISPVGSGLGPQIGITAGGMGGGDTRTNIQKKLDDLKKQQSEYEKGRVSLSAAERPALEKKIAGLERRIDNLETRLKKLDKKNNGECQTCKNRKYQDGSDDPGVSFKSATRVAPEAAASAVRGHEMEHVYRNQAKAAREGKEVVSQSVTIKTGICPECGKPFIAGGETKTVTRDKPEDKFNVGIEKGGKGDSLNTVA